MSNTKTPLELTNSIRNHVTELLELRQISKALLNITSSDPETIRITNKAFANSLVVLAGHAADIYWDASDLKRILENNLLDETKALDDQLEEDLPFVTPSDKKEEVEA